MYQLVVEPTTWIAMEWKDLDSEGFVRLNSIEVQVVLLPLDEVVKIASGSSNEPTIDFALRVSRDWRGLLGPDGKPLPFNKKNLTMMVQKPGFGTGFGVSYVAGWGGKGKVREKNSEGSPPDGPAGTAPKPKRSPRRQSS